MNQKNILTYGLLLVFTVLFACTPKTTDKVTETEPAIPDLVPDENISPCPNFEDAPDPQTALEDFVVYRNLMNMGDWNEAFSYWRRVYEVAPAADGQRNTVLADGITFYEVFAQNESDSVRREAHIDKIFELYDRIDECYPEGGYVNGRKAFDLYYRYPERSTLKGTYDLFKKSVDEDQLDAQDFVINPFTALLVDLYRLEEIPQDEAQKYAALILDIVANGVANCEGEACDRWLIVEQYAPSRLEFFETEEGFFSCDYYIEKYYQDFKANPNDCDVIRTVYSRMRFGACAQDGPEFAEVIAAAKDLCIEEDVVKGAYEALRNANYTEAINLFNAAANKETDIAKKAKYTLMIAKIYFSHLKNYTAARQYARQAAEIRPNWGDPYMLIGRLYASSGPLCGPGRGWASQIVTWPAIDMWYKAKSVDPSVASEANQLIATYTKYMPSIEQIFQRSLKEGDTFYVGCWIQESTKIRAAPRN
jgi:tetratricopeptide (TPR) repeat protein